MVDRLTVEDALVELAAAEDEYRAAHAVLVEPYRHNTTQARDAFSRALDRRDNAVDRAISLGRTIRATVGA